MRYANRSTAVTVAISAAATAMLLLMLIGAPSQARTHASQPSIPPDCYVSDLWQGIGPAAPGGLMAEWSPAFIDGYLLDAFDVVRWTDNSDDETCFVIEMKPSGGGYEVAAIAPGNAEIYHLMSGPGVRTYRVYAANTESRSLYSNEETVNAVYNPPTASPSPSPSPVSPTPSTTPGSQPTPAALPRTGGLP